MNASGGVPGWCNESIVTCMENNDSSTSDDNECSSHVYDDESCMAIYLGMAMEMP